MVNTYEYILSKNILSYSNMADTLYIVLNIGKYICMMSLAKPIHPSYFPCSAKIRFSS